MATTNSQARNVIVGAGHLYTAECGHALPADPDPAGSSTIQQELEAESVAAANPGDWRNVGYTQEGVEVTYQPDYGEVEVDQLKDAARLFNQGVNVMMNTNLAEATLENLLIAWGQPTDALNGQTFGIGVPGSDPVERALAVVGTGAPKFYAQDSVSVGVPAEDTTIDTERVYYARRVVSMEGSNHSLRRTEATIFPVSFRLLPLSGFSGSEYGTITDRLTEPAPS